MVEAHVQSMYKADIDTILRVTADGETLESIRYLYIVDTMDSNNVLFSYSIKILNDAKSIICVQVDDPPRFVRCGKSLNECASIALLDYCSRHGLGIVSWK